MNEMLKYAIVVLAGSIVAMIWGFQYRGDHPMQAVGAFFGYSDPTYSIAGWAARLGVIAFVIGIALLIGGLAQTNKETERRG